jgi:hypothetical protein
MLIELANNVTQQTRRQVKRRWVSLFQELCEPFYSFDADVLCGINEPAEILYELRRV